MVTKTVQLSEDAYRRWEERARRHGRSVSEEIETAALTSNGSVVARAGEPLLADPGTNPNQWLLDFADSLKGAEWKPGPTFGSKEYKEQYVRDLYRDTFNLEPDW